jgi:integrase
VLTQRSPNGVGPVFVNLKGEKLEGYKHWFNQAVERAGLVDFTWYCLRHTFASRLVMAGVDIRTVAELMGHKTIQMTMRYAHLAPEHNLAAVESLISFNSSKPPVRGALRAQTALLEEATATSSATASGNEASSGTGAVH